MALADHSGARVALSAGELEAVEHEFTQFCELLAEQADLRFADGPALAAVAANSNGAPLWVAPGLALELSLTQLQQFAGQLLVLRSRSGEQCLHCSYRGWGALTASQQRLLQTHFTSITTHPLHTIERLTGGSIGLLVAEVHSPHA